MTFRSSPLAAALLLGAVAVPFSLADDFDREVAIGLSQTVVSSLEAGQAAAGLATARQLRSYLEGEDSGAGNEGLAILRRMARIAEVYEFTADSPDAEVVREIELAQRVFRSAVPGQRVRYPNGRDATYRFGNSHEWKFSNGRRLAYRPTDTQEWLYPNGRRMAYRPTDSQEWLYPNGRRIAYRPTSSQEWTYANGQRIAYRPTNTQEWHYPNGRRICYRLGNPSQAWYYPDGTRWMDRGPAYSDEELADVMKVISRILEDSGWNDRRAAGPAAPVGMRAAAEPAPTPAGNPVAQTLRRLERELPTRLRFAGSRPLGPGAETVASFLDSLAGHSPEVFCYEGEAGFLAEVRGPAATLHVEVDHTEAVAWDSLRVEERR